MWDIPAALEREKDKQIESLTRRISELEEENRFIKRKVCFSVSRSDVILIGFTKLMLLFEL
jgi:hypothetical protein